MKNLSIIIPVYNCEQYIFGLLDELIELRHLDIEIICIDDGSTGELVNQLDQYSQKTELVKVIHIENHGPGYARNLGVQHALGKYIAFCDADDRVNIEAFNKMYALAEETSADIVGANYAKVFDAGKIEEVIHNTELIVKSMFKDIAVYGKLYLREYLIKEKISFPEYYQGEDRVFIGKLLSSKPSIVWLNEVAYYYMQHDLDEKKTLTHLFDYKNFKQRMNAWLEFYDVCKETCSEEAESSIIAGLNYIYRLWIKLPTADRDRGIKDIQNLLEKFVNQNRSDIVFGLPFQKFNLINTFKDYAEEILTHTNGRITKHEEVLNPEVSIVIPLYNVGNYLYQCIDSLTVQSFETFEILCVDDGSDDQTEEIILEYMQFDKRIKLLHQMHEGAGAARNLGMKVAKGNYYLFLDGDDFFEPDMLEKVINKILNDDAEICVFGAQMFYERDGSYGNANVFLKNEYMPDVLPFEGKTFPYIFNLSTASPWNKLFKKSLIDQFQVQFMTLPRCNDVFFVFFSLAIARKITILNEILVNYRQWDNSLQATNDKSPRCWYDALIELKSKLTNVDVFENVEESFMNYALSLSMYNLFSYKNGKIFAESYNWLKEEALKNLGLENCKLETIYSYNEFNYNRFRDILEKSVEEYMFDEWTQQQKEKNYWAAEAKRNEREKNQALQEQIATKSSITFRTGKCIMLIPHMIKELLSK